MTFVLTNRFLFKLCSYFPIMWIVSLYLFFAFASISLGHYPVPSLNDPKGLGINFLYYTVWTTYFAFIGGSILWIISLMIAIYQKNISIKHLIIFIVGITISFMQIMFDPGHVIYWFFD